PGQEPGREPDAHEGEKREYAQRSSIASRSRPPTASPLRRRHRRGRSALDRRGRPLLRRVRGRQREKRPHILRLPEQPCSELDLRILRVQPLPPLLLAPAGPPGQRAQPALPPRSAPSATPPRPTSDA